MQAADCFGCGNPGDCGALRFLRRAPRRLLEHGGGPLGGVGHHWDALDLDHGLPPVKLDRNKIQQVFWNLILNAFEAMPKGGRLTVSDGLSPDKRYVQVQFIDSGVGIAAADRQKIFEEFERIRSPHLTHIEGTGLGLPIVKKIVEEHQGTIEISNAPEGGARIDIRLPLVKKEEANNGDYSGR